MNKNTCVVQGFVRYADGKPAQGIKVSAFDRDLRSEEVLGHAETRRDGAYRIEYAEGRFRARERGTADVVVKVLGDAGETIAASKVFFNAKEMLAVDLSIPREKCAPPALFDRIAALVIPLLGEVRVSDLEESAEHQDITFLSGETGVAKRDLARFVLAHQLAHRGIAGEFWFALLGGSVFAYQEDKTLGDNLEAISPGLFGLDTGSVRKALSNAFGNNDLRRGLAERAGGWISAFEKIRGHEALGHKSAPTFIGAALDHARIEGAAHREMLAGRIMESGGMTPDLAAALRKEDALSEREIADVETSYRLAELTRGGFSVVKTLKDRFDVRSPADVPRLARLSRREWVSLVEEEHGRGTLELPVSIEAAPGIGAPAPASAYGAHLEKQFGDAYPTAAFGGGLARALSNGGAHGIGRGKDLGAFLDAHADFDLQKTRIDAFLDGGARAALRGLAKDDEFRAALKATQRVFKLAPTFEATDAMLADGVHSAQMLYRMGESEAVKRYADRGGLGVLGAKRAWRRAADTHGAVMTILGDLKSLDAEALPAAIPADIQALSSFPNWDNLFKAGDVCECQDCRSVLSPAAYFADLLMFLKDRNAKGGLKVKDVLLKRRPDLGYLELNCDNALVPLPYATGQHATLSLVSHPSTADTGAPP